MKTLLVIGAVLFLSACGNYLKQSPIETAEEGEIEKLSSDFESIRTNIFSPRCTTCHQQYDRYESVISELKSIQSAIESDRMPKRGGPLSASQKEILKRWIAKGAPRNSRTGETPPEKPVGAAWATVSAEIIFPKCTVCHSPNGQAKFLDLSSRQSIFSQRNKVYEGGAKLIDFDNPEKSYLIALVTDPTDPMPPPPPFSNISRLTAEQVSLLTEWIALGLP